MFKYYVTTTVISFLLISPFTTSAKSDSYEKLFYTTSNKTGIESFRKNADQVDIIAPQSYTIYNNLTITGSVDEQIKSIAKINDVKIMPLIVNAGFSQTIMHTILTAPRSSQDKIIKFLVDEALKNKYVGWQFDFEHISYMDRDLYSSFVEKTSKAFKKHNLLLSAAVVVRIDDMETNFYKNWSGAFDYKRLSESLDFLSIMTYDDPHSKGPTASMPFVEAAYEYIAKEVPPEKISLGVPFYYWGWSEVPFKKIRLNGSYDRLQYLRSIHKVVEGFNIELKVPFLKYSIGKNKYIVWHEDARSFEYKIDLIKNNNLRGFSAWVLGLENPGIWNYLNK